jgi:hypothetical protein
VSLDACPFCERAVEWRLPDNVNYVYGHARCACGGVGVNFGIPMDSDEGAWELLDELGLGAALPTPAPVPIGASGMIHAVPFDTPKTLADLEARLRDSGFRFALVQEPIRGHERWAVWARPLASS